MPVLLLDTSTTSIVAALLDVSGGTVHGRTVEGRAQGVLALVDELLLGDDPAILDGVVVGTGPGGFTGLRVGVATARGIAETLAIDLHGVDSLCATVATDVVDADGETVWSILDARRGESFARPFRLARGGRIEACGPLRAVQVDAVDDLVGSDRRATRTAPDAESLGRAAVDVLAAAGASNERDLVVPTYGREPDAQPRRMDVRVDELRRDDLDRLLLLERRCFSVPWSRAMYLEELTRPDGTAVRIAARENDTLVGAALAARIGDCWHILNVLVEPAARRRGIAARLVGALLDDTERLGVADGWTLEVRDGNDAAMALYASRGFTVQGRRPGYYAETGEDAIVMWRSPP